VQDGKFNAPGLDAGEWHVSVFHVAEDGRMMSAGAKVQVPEEGTVDVRLSLVVAGR
jgi:hypothetical protein